MDNRFYLQALGVTGLFIILMILFWYASGGPASETAVQNANSTRTAIAMTASYLLKPRTQTPLPVTLTSLPETSAPASTSTLTSLPSPTNTSLLPQPNTPFSSPAPSITPLPSLTPVAQVPVFTLTASSGQIGTRITPTIPPSATPAIVPGTITIVQQPDDFAIWYFTRVWNERDYQNLWDNYLTASYKTNVGSGIFADYVWWWDSVQRVDINTVDVLQNNGSDAWVRVNLTFHMKDGRVVENQIYEYDFLYDSSRGTWMFDSSS